jgi:hypothetical protein
MLQPKDRAEHNAHKIPPVYKLTSDYPGNKDFKIGVEITLNEPFGGGDPPVGWGITVADCQGPRFYAEQFFKMYPHLFQKIQPANLPFNALDEKRFSARDISSLNRAAGLLDSAIDGVSSTDFNVDGLKKVLIEAKNIIEKVLTLLNHE